MFNGKYQTQKEEKFKFLDTDSQGDPRQINYKIAEVDLWQINNWCKSICNIDLFGGFLSKHFSSMLSIIVTPAKRFPAAG